MSDDVDREQKTEQPSPTRLRTAEEEGSVPIGHDVAPVAGLAAAVLALATVAGPLRASLALLFTDVAGSLHLTPFGDLPTLVARPVLLGLAVCAAAAGGAAVATLIQTRGRFWSEKIGFDPSRLFNPESLGRIFSREFFVDLAVSVVKVTAIGWAAWRTLGAEFFRAPRLLDLAPAAQLAALLGILAEAAKPVLAAAALVATADFLVVRWRFMQRMRMTKDEVKREHKDEDGDPTYRGKRKARHREIVRGKVRTEVPRADALVVNPTHVAVAIRYRRDEGRAPRVTAKGKGVLAEHMRTLARENGVPIVEDIPLARLLYRKVKVGREIPAQTYKAVAAILAFVYRVTGRAGGPGARG